MISKTDRIKNINKAVLKALLNTYSCDIKKNNECNKRYCICNNGECKRTTNYVYAKKTLWNYIKHKLIAPHYVY